MNLETKITIYKFTPQLFTLTPKNSSDKSIETIKKRIQSALTVLLKLNFSSFSVTHLLIWTLFY